MPIEQKSVYQKEMNDCGESGNGFANSKSHWAQSVLAARSKENSCLFVNMIFMQCDKGATWKSLGSAIWCQRGGGLSPPPFLKIKWYLYTYLIFCQKY